LFDGMTTGQERFRTLASSYYHKIQGVVLVYDVTRRETFDSLDGWNREVDVNTDGAPVVRVLVGNKIDESDKRQVSRKEGEAWAHEHSMLFVESSAKTRVGVQQVFLETIMRILDNTALVQSAAGVQSTVLSAASAGKSTDDGTKEEGNGGCC
jgi:Ras-related protein Rab-18